MILSRTSSLTPLSASGQVRRCRPGAARAARSGRRAWTMSSNMNILARTSSASSGSRCSRPSRISRSVARSARLMMSTSGSQAADGRGSRSAAARREPALQVRTRPGGRCRATCGPSTAMPVRDVGLEPARPGRPSTAEAWSAVMCASTSAIVCGCSSCRNDSTSWRVGAAQELERHLDEHRLEPVQDLTGACPARGRPLEQVRGVARDRRWA